MKLKISVTKEQGIELYIVRNETNDRVYVMRERHLFFKKELQLYDAHKKYIAEILVPFGKKKYTFKENDRVIDAKGIRVLVIDDNNINIKIFKALLKNSNMVIDEGYSGMECLKMLEENKYDIVFLDHMMPVMDGVETIRKHKANTESINKDTPIIVLTANAIVGAREEYMKEGFSDYLTKPIQIEKLNRIIEENCL